MGLNLKNADRYETRKPQSYADKISALAGVYLTKAYKQKMGNYYNDADNFSQKFMGEPNPFLEDLKKYTLQEITLRSIVDTLSKETLDILREEFTNRVCKVEADSIKVVRIDNNQDKLARMYNDKLEILRASKTLLLTDEVFKFNNGKDFNSDITVFEYLNELCFEIVMSDLDDKVKQTKFTDEVKVLFLEFMKAYGTGIKQKYQFKGQSSLKGVVSGLEVRNEVNVVSNSKIVRWVYKDSDRLLDDDY